MKPLIIVQTMLIVAIHRVHWASRASGVLINGIRLLASYPEQPRPREPGQSVCIPESLTRAACGEQVADRRDSSWQELIPMRLTKEHWPGIRTLRGWAISVLKEADAIKECDDHGWMQDRADPYAHERALKMASDNPPSGVTPHRAVTEIQSVLDSVGDTCPECPDT
jgi:hypothetical protein